MKDNGIVEKKYSATALPILFQPSLDQISPLPPTLLTGMKIKLGLRLGPVVSVDVN